jgi:hypothetical protein
VCGAPPMDASAPDSTDSSAPGSPDVSALGGSPEVAPEVLLAVSDVQPDAGLAVSDGQPDATLPSSDAQPDAASVSVDAYPGEQPDVPISTTTLAVDRLSVDLVQQGLGLDAGVGRPITLGSSGVATVVVTNIGTAASGALAVVPGPGVTTSGCTGALAPSATCTLTILATPTALGQFSSTVSIWATPGATSPIQIAVSAVVVPRPLITSFVASPTAVSIGESSILTAVFSNGTGTVDHGIGAVTSGSGVSTGPITAATTYTLTVTNEFGDFTTAQVRLGPLSCLSQVVFNGFACGSAPPCSACKDGSTSKQTECEAVIKCIEVAYPCTGNCATECFNKNGGNGPVQACVMALQTAACSGSGC